MSEQADSPTVLAPQELARLPTDIAAPRGQLVMWQRVLAAAWVLAVVGLLIVARGLQPAESGYGTHRQLGLPPCSMQWMLGHPCPSCGMTTSWAHAVRGQLDQAWAANPAGTLLLVLAVVTAAWTGLSAGLGQWWRVRFALPAITIALASTMVLAFIRWIVVFYTR